MLKKGKGVSVVEFCTKKQTNKRITDESYEQICDELDSNIYLVAVDYYSGDPGIAYLPTAT